MPTADIPMSELAALEELHALLRESAKDHSPSRMFTVRYQVCRATLMSGEMRFYLPGYLKPCVSLFKFREFICLFDHDPAARIKFIDQSLDHCWMQLNERPAHDTFDMDDF